LETQYLFPYFFEFSELNGNLRAEKLGVRYGGNFCAVGSRFFRRLRTRGLLSFTVAESAARTSEPARFFPSRLPEKSAITMRNFRIAAHPDASPS
jgi:hypothetical protein